MTRATLRRQMRQVTAALGVVLVVALLAKLLAAEVILKSSGLSDIAEAFYDTLKDMAVVIVTIAAVFVAHILQRRSNFIENLEREWRRIIEAKSKLWTYTKLETPDAKDYFAAFCAISEVADGMRVVYRNVGETRSDVGLYPYVPIQDMRRALQTLDPDNLNETRMVFTKEERKLVRDAVIQCFSALRETFLDELDLEEPRRPLLVAAMQRSKRPGAAGEALVAQKRHEQWRDGRRTTLSPVDEMLESQWLKERDRDRQRWEEK